MNRLLLLCLVAVGAASSGLFTNKVHAAEGDFTVDPPVALLGQNGKVVVGESQVNVEFGGGVLNPAYVAYFVDVVDPSTEVAAFAVSGDVFIDNNFGVNAEAHSTFDGWDGRALTPLEWNNGFEFTLRGGAVVTTSALGSAESLFGNDRTISLYYFSEGLLFDGGSVLFNQGMNANDQDPDAWVVSDPSDRFSLRFFATTRRRSEFIALDIGGRVLDVSIPEPSAMAIAAMAFLGLMKRRAH